MANSRRACKVLLNAEDAWSRRFILKIDLVIDIYKLLILKIEFILTQMIQMHDPYPIVFLMWIFPHSAKAIPPSFWATRNLRNPRTNPSTNIPTVSSSTGRVFASLMTGVLYLNTFLIHGPGPTAGIGQSISHIFQTFLDPYVFGHPGYASGYISQRYGSGSLPIQYISSSKNCKKNIDSYCFMTPFWLFIFEKWCKCTFKKYNKQKNLEEKKVLGCHLDDHIRK